MGDVVNVDPEVVRRDLSNMFKALIGDDFNAPPFFFLGIPDDQKIDNLRNYYCTLPLSNG